MVVVTMSFPSNCNLKRNLVGDKGLMGGITTHFAIISIKFDKYLENVH
jgi:hypothetical protein